MNISNDQVDSNVLIVSPYHEDKHIKELILISEVDVNISRDGIEGDNATVFTLV